MRIYEHFLKDQEVFVLTDKGVASGRYVRKNTADTVDVHVENHYATIREDRVFSSKDAAARFLLTGVTEVLPVVKEHESAYNVGDSFFSCDSQGVHEERVTHVQWRLGQWEYHSTCGGAAVYLERMKDYFFKTRDEAVAAYLR